MRTHEFVQSNECEAETMRADMESEERWANQYKSERDEARRENARLREALKKIAATNTLKQYDRTLDTAPPKSAGIYHCVCIAEDALAGEVKEEK